MFDCCSHKLYASFVCAYIFITLGLIDQEKVDMDENTAVISTVVGPSPEHAAPTEGLWWNVR